MTFWGTLAGGGQMLLGAPKEAVLSYDREAPACQLKAIFPAERIWEDLEEVRVYEGGRGLFRGMVDAGKPCCWTTRRSPELLGTLLWALSGAGCWSPWALTR